jgi:hypothetical protein
MKRKKSDIWNATTKKMFEDAQYSIMPTLIVDPITNTVKTEFHLPYGEAPDFPRSGDVWISASSSGTKNNSGAASNGSVANPYLGANSSNDVGNPATADQSINNALKQTDLEADI